MNRVLMIIRILLGLSRKKLEFLQGTLGSINGTKGPGGEEPRPYVSIIFNMDRT